jgi:hypothetical protein
MTNNLDILFVWDLGVAILLLSTMFGLGYSLGSAMTTWRIRKAREQRRKLRRFGNVVWS